MNADLTPTPGQEFEPRSVEITRADLLAYAAASGDHNPIHSDEAVALSVGLPGVIAHGMYTMALMARVIRDWFPGAEVREIGSKFTQPVVVPADGCATIEISGAVKSVETRDDAVLVALTLQVTSDGSKVLGMPKALLALPVERAPRG